MRKILTFILILCTVALFAEMRGGALYDPGAARTNLSNVDAAATPSMTSITLSGKVKAAWADILGDIYASGTVKVSTGTAALPAYSFASDPDTGIFSSAANQLAVSCGGITTNLFTQGTSYIVRASSNAGSESVLRFTLRDTNAATTDYAAIATRIATSTAGAYSGAIVFSNAVNGALAERMRISSEGEVLMATITDAGDYKLQVNGNAYVNGDTNVLGSEVIAGTLTNNGSRKTAYTGGTYKSHKIQERAVSASTVATYTVCTFESFAGNEKFAFYSDILVCGVNGAEAYKVYVGGTANSGNTAISMDAVSVSATTLNGTPVDIVASYSVVGVKGTITIYVPQTYHTMTMKNSWADTRLLPCTWVD